MPCIALVTEFDGTDFVGWQIQSNGRSVQQELQKALTELYKEDIKVTGCSRTDAGVHASGHVCSASVPFFIPPDKIPYALNALLPDDIAVRRAVEVKDGFNARFDSRGKRYIYRISYGNFRRPLTRRTSLFIHGRPDVDAMKSAAQYFKGEHDFAAFCAAGGSQNTTVRRLFEVSVKEIREGEEEGLIEIEVSGEAFLYNMVRIIAGTLLYVGQGKISAEDVSDIIKSGDRKKAGKTLPPHGLTLEEVYYDWDSLQLKKD